MAVNNKPDEEKGISLFYKFLRIASPSLYSFYLAIAIAYALAEMRCLGFYPIILQ